jgi:hypothetical protein
MKPIVFLALFAALAWPTTAISQARTVCTYTSYGCQYIAENMDGSTISRHRMRCPDPNEWDGWTEFVDIGQGGAYGICSGFEVQYN